MKHRILYLCLFIIGSGYTLEGGADIAKRRTALSESNGTSLRTYVQSEYVCSSWGYGIEPRYSCGPASLGGFACLFSHWERFSSRVECRGSHPGKVREALSFECSKLKGCEKNRNCHWDKQERQAPECLHCAQLRFGIKQGSRETSCREVARKRIR